MSSYNLFSSTPTHHSSFDSLAEGGTATPFSSPSQASNRIDPWSTAPGGNNNRTSLPDETQLFSSLSPMRDNSAFAANPKLQFLSRFSSDEVPPLTLPGARGGGANGLGSFSAGTDSLSQSTTGGAGADLYSIWSSTSTAPTSESVSSFHHHPGVERSMPPQQAPQPAHQQRGFGGAPPPPATAPHFAPQMTQSQKLAYQFNVAAPEFRPTAPSSKPGAGGGGAAPNATPAPSQMRHNAPVAGQHRMRRASLGANLSGGFRHNLHDTMPTSTSNHIAPPSGLSETNPTRGGPITIQPAAGVAAAQRMATGRGTSSTQSSAATQSMSRQDYLVKTIYHKLITCQSGDCRRRHSCIECLECNSLFCENCSNINLHALTLVEHGGEGLSGMAPHDLSDDPSDLIPWDFLGGARTDLRAIPGYCPSCDKQERFSINLAMMKLLMKNEEYRKFAALLRRAGGSAPPVQQQTMATRNKAGASRGGGGNMYQQQNVNATGTTKQHAAMKRRGSYGAASVSGVEF